AGYSYTLNWCMDDQPVWLRTRSGPLLAVPYPQEVKDKPSVIARKETGAGFGDLIIDTFDEMLEQEINGPTLPTSCALAITARHSTFALVSMLFRASDPGYASAMDRSSAQRGFWRTASVPETAGLAENSTWTTQAVRRTLSRQCSCAAVPQGFVDFKL
ncbi:MAG: hypothetical protein AAF441_18230, partial [Pseudomonadota bacterium]